MVRHREVKSVEQASYSYRQLAESLWLWEIVKSHKELASEFSYVRDEIPGTTNFHLSLVESCSQEGLIPGHSGLLREKAELTQQLEEGLSLRVEGSGSWKLGLQGHVKCQGDMGGAPIAFSVNTFRIQGRHHVTGNLSMATHFLSPSGLSACLLPTPLTFYCIVPVCISHSELTEDMDQVFHLRIPVMPRNRLGTESGTWWVLSKS